MQRFECACVWVCAEETSVRAPGGVVNKKRERRKGRLNIAQDNSVVSRHACEGIYLGVWLFVHTRMCRLDPKRVKKSRLAPIKRQDFVGLCQDHMRRHTQGQRPSPVRVLARTKSTKQPTYVCSERTE